MSHTMHCHRILGYHFQDLFRRKFCLNRLQEFSSQLRTSSHIMAMFLTEATHTRHPDNSQKLTKTARLFGLKVGLHNVHEVMGGV